MPLPAFVRLETHGAEASVAVPPRFGPSRCNVVALVVGIMAFCPSATSPNANQLRWFCDLASERLDRAMTSLGGGCGAADLCARLKFQNLRLRGGRKKQSQFSSVHEYAARSRSEGRESGREQGDSEIEALISREEMLDTGEQPSEESAETGDSVPVPTHFIAEEERELQRVLTKERKQDTSGSEQNDDAEHGPPDRACCGAYGDVCGCRGREEPVASRAQP